MFVLDNAILYPPIHQIYDACTQGIKRSVYYYVYPQYIRFWSYVRKILCIYTILILLMSSGYKLGLRDNRTCRYQLDSEGQAAPEASYFGLGTSLLLLHTDQ